MVLGGEGEATARRKRQDWRALEGAAGDGTRASRFQVVAVGSGFGLWLGSPASLQLGNFTLLGFLRRIFSTATFFFQFLPFFNFDSMISRNLASLFFSSIILHIS